MENFAGGQSVTAFEPGSPVGLVSIAGAGPGHPDLLTVQTLRRLQSAPAIVYDALVSAEIVALFPPAAQLYDVGKRAERADSTSQDDINRLLVRLARQGLDTLRLKGGDPFIFGRGGEEALYLEAHGVPFEVLPGVSALNGAAAVAGIPLTHRGLSQSCTVLNGYGANLDAVDWAALVALGGTWVFFMGKRSLDEVARRLLRHGARPDLTLALIESATLPSQRVSLLPLQEAAAGRVPCPGDGPALVMVGPSTELAYRLCNGFTEVPIYVTALSDLPQVGGENGSDRGWG